MSDVLRRAMDHKDFAQASPLEMMRARHRLVIEARKSLLEEVSARGGTLLDSDKRDLARGETVCAEIRERISELEAEEKREAQVAAIRSEHFDKGVQYAAPVGYTNSRSGTYHPGPESPSFFRDLRNAGRGDYNAMQRLHQNNQETGLEQRALGNTGATGGSGGEFAPPAWLLQDWVKLARPGRVTADLFRHEPLPAGASSVNLPKVTSGTTPAPQTTQNTAVSQTDLTSAALTSGITTIAGKQVVSQQLLDQSGIPIDRIILEDLAADYAKQLGIMVLTGSGTSGQLRGFLTPSSTNNQTWTQASPTAALFYSQLAKLQGSINTSRYAAPDAVVMHPRRWAWFASFTDSTGRPLVVPTAGGFNSMANPTSNAAAGHVGTVLGMDVYTDPNIPTNLGAGTNQDVVLMFVRDDIYLWESDLRAETFTAPYADSMGVLFRVFNYSAMIPDRYLSSLGQINGTGLVTPTFAG